MFAELLNKDGKILIIYPSTTTCGIFFNTENGTIYLPYSSIYSIEEVSGDVIVYRDDKIIKGFIVVPAK